MPGVITLTIKVITLSIKVITLTIKVITPFPFSAGIIRHETGNVTLERM